MMLNNKKGRADVAAPTQPANYRSISPSPDYPHGHYTSGGLYEQEASFLDFDTECYIVRRQLSDYIRPNIQKFPLFIRSRLYERGKQELVNLSISSEAYEYGISLLAKYLRL